MPIDSDAFFLMLGIAMRAGQLSLGEEGAHKAVASGKAALVLVDEAASANTRKLFADACAHYGVRMELARAGRLAASVGKPGRMSAAVRGGKLCEKLCALADEAAQSGSAR